MCVTVTDKGNRINKYKVYYKQMHWHNEATYTNRENVQPAIYTEISTSLSNEKKDNRVIPTKTHNIVKHMYHDHADDPIREYSPSSKSMPCSANPFPCKLYDMLNEIEMKSYSSDDYNQFHQIISWQPHGRCFLIHKPKEFKTIVLPTYFQHEAKITSFQRQLNLYGFTRLSSGNDKHGYYHESFLRHRRDLVSCMKRVKVKGTKIRFKSNPSEEPDFYHGFSWVDNIKINTTVQSQSFRTMKHDNKGINCYSNVSNNNKNNANPSSLLLLDSTVQIPSISLPSFLPLDRMVCIPSMLRNEVDEMEMISTRFDYTPKTYTSNKSLKENERIRQKMIAPFCNRNGDYESFSSFKERYEPDDDFFGMDQIEFERLIQDVLEDTSPSDCSSDLDFDDVVQTVEC